MEININHDYFKNYFKKIVVAITFSHRLEPIFSEVSRFKKFTGEKFIFIHVGNKTEEKEQIISGLFVKYGFEDAELVWENGNKVNEILDLCEKVEADLLIAGVLTKETMLQYYLGSVARQIIRKSYCSVMLLSEPTLTPRPYKKIAINLTEGRDNDKLASIGISLALTQKSERVYLTKETDVNRYKLLLNKELTEAELKETQKEIIKEENEVFEELIAEIKKNDLEEVEISTKLLYGKAGNEVRNFAIENNVDFLIIHSPYKKLSLIDRIFQHDIEYLLEDLPSDILMINESRLK